mmetsp:Transcript_81025/g.196481  ORF Transcript_81025/g.196481 Transcript_81025/m.196481 type:complete len:210 (+) Transcript_81025:1358-1987(+)
MLPASWTSLSFLRTRSLPWKVRASSGSSSASAASKALPTQTPGSRRHFALALAVAWQQPLPGAWPPRPSWPLPPRLSAPRSPPPASPRPPWPPRSSRVPGMRKACLLLPSGGRWHPWRCSPPSGNEHRPPPIPPWLRHGPSPPSAPAPPRAAPRTWRPRPRASQSPPPAAPAPAGSWRCGPLRRRCGSWRCLGAAPPPRPRRHRPPPPP